MFKFRQFIAFAGTSFFLLGKANLGFAQGGRVFLPAERESYQGKLSDEIVPSAKTFSKVAQHPAPNSPWNLGTITLPYFSKLPPDLIEVDEGEKLTLSVGVRTNKKAYEEGYVSWVLDGNLVCIGEVCELSFGPKLIRAGKHKLQIVVYHPFGSTTSDHEIAVNGTGKDANPTAAQKARVVESGVGTRRIARLNKSRPAAYMLSGASLFTGDKSLTVIGFTPRNIAWNEKLEVFQNSQLHISVPGQSEIILQDAEGKLRSSEDLLDRIVELKSGNVRVNTTLLGRLGGSAPDAAYQVTVETPEAAIVIPIDSEVLVLKGEHNIPDTQEKKSAKPKKKPGTRVIVVSGAADAQVKGKDSKAKAQTVNLPAGSEIILYSDLTTTPLQKPEADDVEKILKSMLSRKLLESRVSQLKSEKAPEVEKSIDEVERMLGEDLSYDALVLLEDLPNDVVKKDARLLYLTGLAFRRIFFVSEAEQYFQAAVKVDSKFSKALWQLAEMRTETSDWKAAAGYLEKLGELIDSGHELYPRYLYLTAVVQYKLGENFSALNDFKRAMWENELPEALRSSAFQFLDAIAKRKPLNLVVLSGFQYDGNPLGLASDAKLPDGFASRTTLKSLLGAVVTWEKPPEDPRAVMPGYGFQSFYVKNFDPTYAALDAFVFELSASQTFRKISKQTKVSDSFFHSDVKLAESVNFVLLNGKPVSQTFMMGVQMARNKVSLGVERTSPETLSSGTYSILAAEEFGFDLGLTSNLRLELPFKFEQSFPLEKTEGDGLGLTFEVTPGVNFPFTQKLSLQAGILFSYETVRATVAQSTFKVGPTSAVTYFLTPWLISGASLSYEWSKQSAGGVGSSVSKPNAGVTLTGIF